MVTFYLVIPNFYSALHLIPVVHFMPAQLHSGRSLIYTQLLEYTSIVILQ